MSSWRDWCEAKIGAARRRLGLSCSMAEPHSLVSSSSNHCRPSLAIACIPGAASAGQRIRALNTCRPNAI